MGIIKQNSWVSGEINPDLISASNNKLYYSSALTIENMYLTKSQTLKRMLSTRKADNTSLTSYLTFSAEYLGNSYFIVVNYNNTSEKTGINVKMLSKNSSNDYVLLTGYTDANKTKVLDYVVFENKIIFTHENQKPSYVEFDNTGITSHSDFSFTHTPTMDFGNVNYNSWKFDFDKDGNEDENDTMKCTVTGTGCGLELDKTNKWLNGAIYSLGTDTSNYLGYGIIKTITKDNDNQATLILNVIHSFEKAKTNGNRVDLQQVIFYDDTQYPKKVAFFDSRLYFANTKDLPMLICGSKINIINNFDIGKAAPSEAIVYVLKESSSSEIMHMSGLKGLFIFSDSHEHLVLQAVDQGITPQNFISTKLSDFGSSNVKPKVYNNNVYIVDKTGKRVISFAPDGTVVDATEGMYIKDKIKQLDVLDSGLMNQKGLVFIYDNDNFLNLVISTGEYHGLFRIKISPYTVGNIAINRDGYIADIQDSDTTKSGIYELISNISGLTSIVNSSGITFPLSYDGYLYNESTNDYLYIEKNTSPTIPAGYTKFGFKNDVYVKSVPMYGNSQGEYYFNKVSSYFIAYYDSSRFKLNGNIVAKKNISELSSTQPSLKTQSETIRASNKNNQRRHIEVTSEYPYNIEIMSYGININPYIMG
jgi:hypothetical protein